MAISGAFAGLAGAVVVFIALRPGVQMFVEWRRKQLVNNK